MYPRIGDKPEATQSQPSQKSIMQVITTKIMPATNTKPTRIKASCERGSIIVSYDHAGSAEEGHRHCALKLCRSFVEADAMQHGEASIASNPWARPFVSGQLANGDWVHVETIDTKGLIDELREVCAQFDALLVAHGKPFGWGQLTTKRAKELIAKVEGSK